MMIEACIAWSAFAQRAHETAKEHTNRVHDLIRSRIIDSTLGYRSSITIEEARRTALEVRAVIGPNPKDPSSAIIEWELPNFLAEA